MVRVIIHNYARAVDAAYPKGNGEIPQHVVERILDIVERMDRGGVTREEAIRKLRAMGVPQSDLKMWLGSHGLN